MSRYIIVIILFVSLKTYAQDAFFNLGMGPDMNIKSTDNAINGTRFRMNIEVGGKHLGFIMQPSFGYGVNSLFFGPRFMLPFQIGQQPLFVVPDFCIGVDFGFNSGVVGTAMDMKFGLRVFYELQDGIGLTFRPFGLSIRPFNIWYGNTPNQTQISVRYELIFGMVYFF